MRNLPTGKLILDHHYYTYSSVVFYTGLEPLLLNGKFNNLEYGAAAPGVPGVFLTDAQFTTLWTSKERCYLVGSQKAVQRLRDLLGAREFETVLESGGKLLVTNRNADAAVNTSLARPPTPAPFTLLASNLHFSGNGHN